MLTLATALGYLSGVAFVAPDLPPPVLLGTGLMTLVFVSSSSGHDEAAAPHVRKEIDEK